MITQLNNTQILERSLVGSNFTLKLRIYDETLNYIENDSVFWNNKFYKVKIGKSVTGTIRNDLTNSPDIDTVNWEEYIPYTTISTVDPLPTDDITQGHLIGSTWIDTDTDNIFVCTDNTINNAVWVSYIINDSLLPIIDLTYNDLITLRDANDLVPGQMYKITDYETIYTQPVTNILKSSGVTEPLIILATNINTFDKQVYSELYTNDYIEYDIDNNETEIYIEGVHANSRITSANYTNLLTEGVTYNYTFGIAGILQGGSYIALAGDTEEDLLNIIRDYIILMFPSTTTEEIITDGSSKYFDITYEINYTGTISTTIDAPITTSDTLPIEPEGSLRPGKITYRKDTINQLETYYDFRTVLFARWETFTGSGLFTVLFDNGEAMQESLTFGSNCYDIFIGKHTNYNNIVFGNINHSITFGIDNYSMTFGNVNYSMTFGETNYYMTFGSANYSITFGDKNNSIIVGNVNYSITFGDGNVSINFNDDNHSINFKNLNSSITFGDSNLKIEIGNDNDFSTLTLGINSIALLQNSLYEKILYSDNTNGFMIKYIDNSDINFIDATT